MQLSGYDPCWSWRSEQRLSNAQLLCSSGSHAACVTEAVTHSETRCMRADAALACAERV